MRGEISQRFGAGWLPALCLLAGLAACASSSGPASSGGPPAKSSSSHQATTPRTGTTSSSSSSRAPSTSSASSGSSASSSSSAPSGSSSSGSSSSGSTSGPGPNSCLIQGQTFAAGQFNPDDACLECDPAENQLGWSTYFDGASCGTGMVCSSGNCVAECFIGGGLLDAGSPNPAIACQQCVPASSTTTWSESPNGTPCDGGICDQQSCEQECFIEGQVVQEGLQNPANGCQQCTPSASTSAWTTLANGTSCGFGFTCIGGLCGSICEIDGGVVDAGAVNPTDACQACVPTTLVTGWTTLADGTSCGAGAICTSGTCSASCSINGKIVPSGTPNAGNACQACQPALSTNSYSDLPNGTGCGGSDVCFAGSCSGGCDIDGGIVKPSTVNPANPCQLCLPSSSTSNWSNEPDGLSCGAKEVCSAGQCVTGCGITIGDAGLVFASGAIPSFNPCVSCQPSVSTTSLTSLANGLSCGTGLTCNAGSCCGGTVGTLTCDGGQVDSCLDDLNCGACGSSCPAGELCFAGACTTPAPLPTARDSLGVATGSDGHIYAIGGTLYLQETLATVESFNPRTNSWASGTSMPQPVQFIGASANDAGIFVFGGYFCDGGCASGSNFDEKYGQFLDVATGVWSQTPPAPVSLAFTWPAPGPGGAFFLPGGQSAGLVTSQTLTFTPSGAGAAGSWSQSAPALPAAVGSLGVTSSANGTIYAVNGTSNYQTPNANVWTLAPGGNSWGSAPVNPTPRCDMCVATDHKGLIYVIGGDNCDWDNTGSGYFQNNVTEIFNPGTGTWTQGAYMPIAIAYVGCSVGTDGRIYVVGGEDFQDENFVQVYDPVTQGWTVSTPN